MKQVDNVEDFFKCNDEELRRFLTNGKKIYDVEVVNDILQNFYLRLVRSGALKRYDQQKGSFNTFIITILCNMLPHEKKKNVSIGKKHISVLSNPSNGGSRDEDVDIFDYIHISNNSSPDYSIAHYDYQKLPSCFYQHDEDDCTKHMMAFIEYVKKTEPNKEKLDRMVCYLESRMDGCLATDVAKILGVSDNMVKIMKNVIYDKYKKWDSPRELKYV